MSASIPGDTAYQSSFFTSVQTSFHNQHSVSLLGSTVSAQYDFEIMQSLAEYNIQTQLNCVSVDNDRPDCLVGGNFMMTPRTDVWVEATGSYAYALPTDSTSQMRFTVLSIPDTGVNFGSNQTDDTFLTGPHNGLFHLNMSGLVPAGTTVQVSYNFRTTFVTGAVNNLPAASSGNLHIVLTPVPEPAALAPLALAAIYLLRPKPRH